MKATGRERIRRVFRRLAAANRGALIPFLMAGDPDRQGSLALARATIAAGADILELGIPFSDPVADGPVIGRAGERALAAGMTVGGVLALAAELRKTDPTPLVLMTYWNPVLSYGPGRFLRDALRAGVDGLIFVDLPPREDPGFFVGARRLGLATVLLTSPTTPAGREERLARESRGFVYLVSRAGITGVRGDLPAALEGRVRRLRGVTPLPIAVGFGIGTPRQVRLVLQTADAAVVGSALVAAIEAAPAGMKEEAARSLIASLAAATSRGAGNGPPAVNATPKERER